MFGLHALDVAVLLSYLVGITAVGVWVSRRVRDTSHYFMGGRGFGKLLMIGQAFGVGTHAEQPVAVAGAAYQHGISGIWYQWKYIFCTPFYWLLAPIFRRLRYVTTADFYHARFGARAGVVYTVYALVFFMIIQGAMLRGASKVLAGATGGAIEPAPAIVCMTIAFTIYSFMGGLVSVAVTDFIQGFFVIAMSVMLIPLGLRRVGGVDALHQKLDPGMFDLWSSAEISVFFIAVLSLNSLIGIFAQPHHMATIGSGRTEMNCRVGFTYGNFIKRLCTVGWAFLGLIVAVMIPGLAASDREQVFGLACRELLPAGGVGLMIACVLAANLDTNSAFMVNTGALFTQNVYRAYLRPEASERRCLWVGRVAGVVMTLGAVAVSFLQPRVLDGILFAENLAALMGVSFIVGVVWPRANRWGAYASFAAGLAVYYGGAYLRCRGAFDFRTFIQWQADLSLASLLAGLGAMIVVSRLTPPEPKEALDEFYARLHAPAADATPAAGIAAVPAEAKA